MWRFLDSLPPVGLPLLMFYFFSLRPALKVRRARSWRRTACVIVGSSVSEDETDSGLYRIDVAYEYEYGGQRYSSSRFSFSPASATAGRRLKRRVARRLAPGTAATCYVDPDDPGEAVIDRGVTWDMVMMGVLAMVFLAGFFFVFDHGGF